MGNSVIADVVAEQREGDELARIERNFAYNTLSNDQIRRRKGIREAAKKFALLLKVEVPRSREQSIAMTKLEEVVMWATAGIRRNE